MEGQGTDYDIIRIRLKVEILDCHTFIFDEW